jgi:hypothetical protein
MSEDLDKKQKHNRVLLHALQTCHPVLLEGQSRFIHTLTYQILGGGIDTTIYLTGDQTPIKPEQVQLQEQPK